jgi:hypothetical protein
MPSTMENLSTINSFLRTILAMIVLGAVGAASYVGYTTYNQNEINARKSAAELAKANEALQLKEQEVAAKTAELAEKTKQLQEKEVQIASLTKDVERLETSLSLLKVNHRLAKLTVTKQGTDESTGQSFSLVEFVELNDEGAPIDTPREFRVPGEQVYIDSLIVKFEDKYIEQADIERGTSLILFNRIFGDKQQPADGFPLDERNTRPKAYARGGKMTDLERKIWGDFWNIANDKARAAELGIRAAHGGAVSMKVQNGKTYNIKMRSTGEITIEPDDKPAVNIER